MKKRKVDIPNLAEASFSQALNLAYSLTPLSFEDIAERMGKGTTTINRYFTDPEYNPPTHLLPKLCKAIDNDILLDWLCLHAGGYLVRVDSGHIEAHSLDIQIAMLTKEFADVLMENGNSMLDGIRTKDELIKMDKELVDLTKKSEQVRHLISKKKAELKG